MKTNKCEKCGKEATFYYSSNINGEKTEHCYCADCAREEGYAGALDYQPLDLFGGFDDFFGDFFAPARSLMHAFDSFGAPFGRIMAPSMPRLRLGCAQPAREQTQRSAEPPQTQAEASIPSDAGAEIKSRREREQLRHRLDEAVKAENFEKAIELRDQLRKLDENQG